MNLIILGSTGSIGTQTLDIVREQHPRFSVVALTAGRNWELLARQALEFRPRYAVIADERFLPDLRNALKGTGIETASGAEAIRQVAGVDADVVVTAMVGYSGLLPTIEALKAGRRIALANKETLVVAGQLITRLAKENPASEIIPVDSEHSAIFQCLVGEDRRNLSKIILTASGGPFRKMKADDLENVTAADALKHPNWEMGPKVTIDSASMMNKGFEMIEARWLFDCSPDDIEIAVHPQSIVHSMVEFSDGSVKAQLGLPDMRIPIGYALGYPDRLISKRPALTIDRYAELTFERPDFKKFPMLGLAFDAIKRSGNTPCVLNAANEIAVEAFLNGRIKFTQMARIAEKTISKIPFISEPTLEDLIMTNQEAREFACDCLTCDCLKG